MLIKVTDARRAMILQERTHVRVQITDENPQRLPRIEEWIF